MFQALICPPSGVCDYVVKLTHWLNCSWIAVCCSQGAVQLGWYAGWRLKHNLVVWSYWFFFFKYHNDTQSNKHQIHIYCLPCSFLRCLDLVPAFFVPMFQLPSSFLVVTLHIVHHEIVLCCMMWKLIYIQWVTFICK